MNKKLKAIVAVAVVAAASIGTALFLNNRPVQLNVTALESTVQAMYPSAVITSITPSLATENVYLVKVTIEGTEYKIFSDISGFIINTSPPIPEQYKNQDI